MKVVTAAQMRDMDRQAADEFGLPGLVLMENAGRAVVAVMEREFGPLAGKRIVIFCGGGNNGGDGFVIARYLKLLGCEVNWLLAGNPDALKGDAQTHYRVLQSMEAHAPDPNGIILLDTGAIPSFPIDRADLVVDALLGTGIKDAPRPVIANCIRQINATRLPVVSVDIPSGINADTGATPGEVVRATHTVTFAYPKIGLYLPPGSEKVGKLHVADIGFRWNYLDVQTPYRVFAPPVSGRGKELPGEGDEERLHGTGAVDDATGLSRDMGAAWQLLQKRHRDANKGEYGHIGVVAGSRGMVGAPAMVARAAQHSGAGLVTVLAPDSAQPVIAGKLDEQMTLALPEVEGAFGLEAFEAIADFAKKATVLCIGPGMTTKPQAMALVVKLLAELDVPIVLDADGLNALAANPNCLQNRPYSVRAPRVLTPHPGEAARLLGTSIQDVQSNRIRSATALASKYRSIVVLKGRYTLTANPDGKIWINTTGNPGMASGGSGDALTGVIGGLLGQALGPGKTAQNDDEFPLLTVSPFDAVALAVYAHGLAGNLAAETTGERGLVAGDIVAHVSQAMRLLEESH